MKQDVHFLYGGVVALQKNSFIDFPQTVAAVLFFDQCNLACPYCHNAVLASPEPAPVSDSAEEIDRFLRRWKHRIDGVVITGGEPTLHENLPALTEYLKHELGYAVKIDTNGLMPDVLPRLTIDYIALDVKATPEKYQQLLAGPSDSGYRIQQSLNYLSEFSGASEVRVTLAPRIIEPSDMETLGRMLTGVETVYLQSFDDRETIYDSSFFKGYEKYDVRALEKFCEYLRGFVENCIVR
ncbi:MAG: anaerobic ribonucleoside-triphosphate reductase activating protein [Fibrobacterota bacterium]